MSAIARLPTGSAAFQVTLKWVDYMSDAAELAEAQALLVATFFGSIFHALQPHFPKTLDNGKGSPGSLFGGTVSTAGLRPSASPAPLWQRTREATQRRLFSARQHLLKWRDGDPIDHADDPTAQSPSPSQADIGPADP